MNYKKLIFILILFIGISIGIYYLYKSSTSNYKDFKFGLCSINEPYADPKIIKNIITKDEAQELIDWAGNGLDGATVGGIPRLKDAVLISYTGVDLSHRNNKVAWLDKDHAISKKIINKISKLVNLPSKNFESVQICNYQPGQFFNHHQDQCYSNEESCINDLKRGGQRLFNCLLYLNENFQGGETDFSVLKKKYKLPIGYGILWAMTNKDGSHVHPKGKHAGLPVKSGEKWIANVWARKNTFVF